ncbi:All-trans-hexaprenyl-diphosphate synthase [hydrothermal vent metagenome]|uniref:All-trans-hexaprenyl-diphosphate synthase n=1 Tax=hydrothermal vent metagenome TaxID=652676 RepID=A0A3B1DCR4_9ZZZZ
MSKDVAGETLLLQIDGFLNGALGEVEEILQTELSSHRASVTDVLAHVSRFRGKRLRPTLLLLAASACGEINQNHKVLAAVVEMIHMATLVHDDVLDDAATRRHVATVNRRWNTETSVLFGDYLFTHAFHLAASLESTFACRLIGRATNIVCEGELTQIHERGNLHLDEAGYLQIIEGKTAELCAVSCFLGAHFTDVNDETKQAIEQYGRSLGIAFQIADDLLDILGDEETTGKTLGSDLTKQKLTLPLIRLLDQASSTDTVKIRELLSEPNEETWSHLLPYVEQSDAFEYARKRALEFAASAKESLAILKESPAKQILSTIAEFSVQRMS